MLMLQGRAFIKRPAAWLAGGLCFRVLPYDSVQFRLDKVKGKHLEEA